MVFVIDDPTVTGSPLEAPFPACLALNKEVVPLRVPYFVSQSFARGISSEPIE
jgi:hypothetical protein